MKVTVKDSSTQSGKSQILSPTSVNKKVNSSSTDNRSTLSGPTSAGYSGVAAPKPAASTITKSVAANLPTLESREIHDLPRRVIKHSEATGCPKANDKIALHNKFGALEDMGFAPSPSSTCVRSPSPIKHTKQT